jgi:phosphatidylglycerophosphatase A
MARIIASFFGTGLILRRLRGADMGSGTVGALFALVLALLLGRVGVWAQAIALAIVIVAALVSVRPFASTEGDPGWVVIDEAAGTMVATLGLGVRGALVAWVVFRAADIFKRAFPGVAAAERLPGTVGVTADDLLAGLYGLAAGVAFEALL